jgi:hypothetical protein
MLHGGRKSLAVGLAVTSIGKPEPLQVDLATTTVTPFCTSAFIIID